MGRTYYDDNFGCYAVDSEDDVAFYRENQRRSRRKKCQGCGRMVKLLPDYAYCNSCVERRERGGEP